MEHSIKGNRAVLGAFAFLVVNVHICKGVVGVIDLILVVVYCFLVRYSWRKTKICPLEIMARIGVLAWPRAFRLMYKQDAMRMQLLYLGSAILVLVKTLYLLYLLAAWLRSFSL